MNIIFAHAVGMGENYRNSMKLIQVETNGRDVGNELFHVAMAFVGEVFVVGVGAVKPSV